MTKQEYMNNCTNALKDAGRILIEQADNLCADTVKNRVSDISIWIRFDAGRVPTMEFEKNYCLNVEDDNND